MFKKVLAGVFVLSLTTIIGLNAFAQTSNSYTLNVYNEDLASPLNYDVKTGDTLNLQVVNKSRVPVTFEVPLMNVSVQIDKNTQSTVPLNFSNPSAKTVWFIIKYAGGNNKTGQFAVTDYTVNVPTSNVEGIDTSVLKDIINYDTTFVYDEKPEPIYSSAPSVTVSDYSPVEPPIYTEPTPEPVTKPSKKPASSGYVRGYW